MLHHCSNDKLRNSARRAFDVSPETFNFWTHAFISSVQFEILWNRPSLTCDNFFVMAKCCKYTSHAARNNPRPRSFLGELNKLSVVLIGRPMISLTVLRIITSRPSVIYAGILLM